MFARRPLYALGSLPWRRPIITSAGHAEVDRILRSGSHFETLALNVAEASTLKGAAVLKAQYQKLVKLVHPDVCSHPRAREAFNRVQKANALLKAGPNVVSQHAAFVRKQEKTATGLFAWLQAHAPLLTLVHAAYVVAGAVLLQCAIVGMRTLAGVNSQQLKVAETHAEEAQKVAHAAAARRPPVPRPPPLGPAFSSDAGQPLLGFSSADIEAALRVRQRVRQQRQADVLANSGLANLKQPVIRAKVGAAKANAGEPPAAGAAVAGAAVAGAAVAGAAVAEAAVAGAAVAGPDVAEPAVTGPAVAGPAVAGPAVAGPAVAAVAAVAGPVVAAVAAAGGSAGGPAKAAADAASGAGAPAELDQGRRKSEATG